MFSLKISFERWKWNKEYGCYVSSLGNFKDKNKNPIPIKITKGGYVLIKCENNSYQLAHRMVMKTFHPTINMEVLTVDHLNHNKRDNSLNNLEWVTKEENLKRASNDYLGHYNFNDNVLYAQHIDEFVDFLLSNPKYTIKPAREKMTRRVIHAIMTNSEYDGFRFVLDGVQNNLLEKHYE